MPPVDVVRTYLELTSPTQLLPCASPDPRARVERVVESPVSFFRYLYQEVGRLHFWLDRLAWSDDELRQRLAQPGVSLHVLTVAAAPAGYFELERHPDASVEIAYLGLLPEFHGRGLGGFLLSEAVRAGWATSASRVWLHTCTLDSPAALPNYLARGFRPFKEERYVAEIPAGRSLPKK
jgi:GNAT superfamily N-acetyltransferase